MPVTYNTWHSEYEPKYRSWTERHVDEFKGAVVGIDTTTVQVMSDIWEYQTHATVWDETKGELRTLFLSAENTKPEEQGSAVVDATPEVLVKVRAYLTRKNYESYKANLLRTAQETAVRPEKGKTVKVVSGRSFKGTVGKVVAIIARPYNMGYRSVMQNKLGVATSDRTIKVTLGRKTFDRYLDVVWVWARNVEVQNPEQYMDAAALDAQAVTYAYNQAKYAMERFAEGMKKYGRTA